MAFKEYILDTFEIEKLMRPVEGQGGWQSLLRRLQNSLDEDILRVDQHDFFIIVGYARSGMIIDGDFELKHGGWQDRVPVDLRWEAVNFAIPA